MTMCYICIMKMEIRYTLPGKTRPRVFIGTWEKGLIEAFRQLYDAHPNAEAISFDGHLIRKKA